jgi:hypothetical protein
MGEDDVAIQARIIPVKQNNLIFLLKRYMFRSEIDNLQVSQYSSFKKKVQIVNNFCEIYLQCLPFFETFI